MFAGLVFGSCWVRRAVDDFFFLTGWSVCSSSVCASSAFAVESVVDGDSVVFVSVVFDESVELVSDVADEVVDSVGVAHANPAGAPIAVPMPRTTARAPTRPMYLLCPVLAHATAAAFHRYPSGCCPLHTWPRVCSAEISPGRTCMQRRK